jgi:flagella basal body P-ring formation protein FlgA
MDRHSSKAKRDTASARIDKGYARGIAMSIALGVAAAFGLPAAAHGAAAQSHAAILETAQAFLRQQLQTSPGRSEIRLGQLDRRLRLAPCDAGLKAFLPPGATLTGNTSVGVQCTGATAWKVYVPAQIVIIDRVVISRGFIPRGTLLTRDHLTMAEREINAASQGYIKDIEDALGRQLKHPIREGLLITPGMLERPALVKRGDEVTILSRTSALEVRMKGNALASGAEGDRIRVRNLRSSRIIEGVVRADGTVVVQM